MTETLYSIGDASLLWTVLNGLAAIMGSTDNLVSLARVGFIVGAICAVLEAIMNGGREIKIGPFFVGIVVYFAMFGMKMTLVVVDVYSGTPQAAVANVPLGVGLPAAYMSQIANRLTTWFEQGFSTPKMMADGFAGSLQLLMDSRNFTTLPPVLNGGTSGQEDIGKSFFNFETDCVASNLGTTLSQNAVESAPYQLGYLQSASAALASSSTLLFIDEAGTYPSSQPVSGNGHAFMLNCSDARDALDARASKLMADPAFGQAYSAMMGCSQAGITGGTCDKATQLNNALNSIAQSQDDSAHYMIQALTSCYYQQALNVSGGEANPSAVAMTCQAEQQRAVNEAGNATMFARMVRPMLTFMEIFIYGAAPFMVFLIGLGAIGLKTVVRYFQMAVWIQLWMPLMALLNLYVNETAQGQLTAFTTTGGQDPGSILGIASMGQFNDYMASIGIIATSIPALAMFLIYTGSVAGTALMGRMQAGNFINEKLAAPDIANPSPALTTSPLQTQDALMRSNNPAGIERVLPKIDVGTSTSGVETSSRAAAESNSLALTQGLSHQLSSVLSRSESGQVLTQLSRDYSSSSDSRVSGTYQQALAFAHSRGLEGSQAEQAAAALTLQAAGGVQASAAKAVGLVGLLAAPEAGLLSKQGMNPGKLSPIDVTLKGSVEGKVGDTTTSSSRASQSETNSDSANLNVDQSTAAALRSATANSVAQNYNKMFSDTKTEGDQKNLQNLASKVVSEENDYRLASQLQHQYSILTPQDPIVTNSRIAQSSLAQHQIQRQLRGNDDQLYAKYQESFAQFRGYGLSAEKASAAAYVKAVNEAPLPTNADGTLNVNTLQNRLQGLGQVLHAAGVTAPPGVDSGHNRDLLTRGAGAEVTQRAGQAADLPHDTQIPGERLGAELQAQVPAFLGQQRAAADPGGSGHDAVNRAAAAYASTVDFTQAARNRSAATARLPGEVQALAKTGLVTTESASLKFLTGNFDTATRLTIGQTDRLSSGDPKMDQQRYEGLGRFTDDLAKRVQASGGKLTADDVHRAIESNPAARELREEFDKRLNADLGAAGDVAVLTYARRFGSGSKVSDDQAKAAYHAAAQSSANAVLDSIPDKVLPEHDRNRAAVEVTTAAMLAGSGSSEVSDSVLAPYASFRNTQETAATGKVRGQVPARLPSAEPAPQLRSTDSTPGSAEAVPAG